MNDPMPKPPSGAIHQKRAWRKISRTPAHWTAHPDASAGGAVSGTRQAIANATTKVMPPSAKKICRHVAKCKAASSGAVAASAPTPPATMIQPAIDGCRSGGYHIAIAFNGAIRQTQTPAPMAARAATRPGSVSASPNAMAPTAATHSSTGSTRRAPKRSSSMPAGICISPKASR